MPLPYIPETITVHLGAPRSNAANVTVPFPDYIKNVASSEIYPTWPESALRANILAQISSLVAETGANIESMTNKSRKDYACTIVDVNTRITDKVADDLRAIPCMIRVRVINH